jgi:hypothetical protein
MLSDFCIIRSALEHPQFQQQLRCVEGTLQVTAENINLLINLQEGDHIEAALDGRSISYLPDVTGKRIQLRLKIGQLQYYEDLNDLVLYTAEEPDEYFVQSIGNIRQGEACDAPKIASYRQMLRARKFLRSVAEFEDTGKAILLTPERLDIPLVYKSADIPPLVHLEDLENQFSSQSPLTSTERDHRLVLLRKSLREFLKSHAPEQRFGMFLNNFETIYDSYVRDYQLWVGNSFGELEKTFEEKRLKFVGDLNGILASVQTSILAVPVATILLGDKYDFANPLKNFLLATAVVLLGRVSHKLLENQEHTLDATRAAIDATKQDFEKKHTRRKAEFETRLANLDQQEQRVRSLLGSMRSLIWTIMAFATIAWFCSAVKPCLSRSQKQPQSDQQPPSVHSATKVSPEDSPASGPQILPSVQSATKLKTDGSASGGPQLPHSDLPLPAQTIHSSITPVTPSPKE